MCVRVCREIRGLKQTEHFKKNKKKNSKYCKHVTVNLNEGAAPGLPVGLRCESNFAPQSR